MRLHNLYIKRYATTAMIIFVIIFILGGIFFMITKVSQTQSDTAVVAADVESLRQRVVKSQSSISLSESQVDRYNKILDQLIPNKEDYFSILYSLEKLSEDTGFNISKYSLNLAQSKAETLTIGIEGSGNTDSFFKFLNDYQFKGGRFITSDRVDIASSDTNVARLTLHFYTYKFNTVVNAKNSLTSKDLQLIESIANKTSIVVKQANNEVVEYPVKNNPF